MSEHDLIRRGDLKTRVDLFAALMIGAGYAEFANVSRKMVLEIMAALPAVAASQPADPVTNADSRQRVGVKPDAAEILAKEMQAIVAVDRWKGRDLSAAPPEKWHHLRAETRKFWIDTAARILAAIDVQTAPQCCMCGKRGLSTAEDGGPECELHDGRWTCSRKCYDAACSLMAPPLDVQPDPRDAQIAALVEAAEAAISKYESGTGSDWKPWFDLLRAAIAAAKGGDA